MIAAIVNDTTKAHFGCQLVMQTFREQLARVDIELIGTVPGGHQDLRRYRFLDRADLVIVNGEGTIHDGKRLDLIELAAHYPAVLINCVYQNNPLRPEIARFKYIAARESLSAAELRQHGAQVEIVPDVMFSSQVLRRYRRRAPINDLGISDNVADAECGFSAIVGLGRVVEYLDILSSFRRLCLGRFHAVVAASVLGIPFSAWASNTHKTKGLMKDMQIDHLYAEILPEAAALAPYALPESVRTFQENARARIDKMFEQFHTLV